MLMFKPHLALKVMDGAKVVTRRAVNDNPRSLWGGVREVRGVHAVVPGRGLHQVGKVEVTSCERQRLGHLSAEEARREGFDSVDGFDGTWIMLHGDYDPDAPVWRVEFHVVETAPCTCPVIGMGPAGALQDDDPACVWHGEHGIRVSVIHVRNGRPA